MKRSMILLVAVLLVIGCGKGGGRKSRPATKKLTAANLLEFYSKDEAGADDAYKGKFLKLDGVLHRVVKLEDGRQAAVLFKDVMFEPAEDGYVLCIFPEAEAAEFAEVQEKQKATISGKVTGKQTSLKGAPFEGPVVVVESSWVDMKPFTCPECKAKSVVVDSADNILCPHCGAKLKRK